MASDLEPTNKLNPATAREAAVAQEAFKMRARGADYQSIAKALNLEKGWTQAYKLVARAYGDAVASQDKERLRLQEAGRLMYMRALLEDRVKEGDEKAIELDLKYTAQIVDILGLKDGVVSGSGGAGVAVQVINSIPPWERGGVAAAGNPNDDGPAPDVVEGEAVDEPAGDGE